MKNLLLLLPLFLFAFAPAGETGYKVGDKAEDFNLPGVDGKMVSMASMNEAKGYIVIFSCNTCPYVVASEDRMVTLHNKYAPQGFPVIAINPNDTKIKPEDDMKHMKARAKEKGFTFPYLRDDTQEVTRRFGATRTPHVYLLEKEDDGLYVRYIGAIDDNTRDANAVKEHYLEDAIAAVQNGEKPQPDYTRAIGCTIKWAGGE
ncbi:MAG: thioredoxin family protein [Bacteroidia bacterium]